MEMEEQLQMLPPPSYGSLFNDSRSGLSYIDFLPVPTKEGVFSKPECESFGNVVVVANQWLSQNLQWEIKTCESVEFKDDFGDMKPSKMIYEKREKYVIYYIRGLRLWLKLFPPGQERVQQIGYVNLVPEKSFGGQFDTLDDVLLKFNNSSRMSPLPGRIITIESQEMKLKKGDFNPDRSRWSEHGPTWNNFIYVIRIFYEISHPLHEEIGMTDFVPEIFEKNCCGFITKCETFSTLFEKAARWCSLQSELKICNFQSLTMREKDGINSRTMSYPWSWTYNFTNLRILRVAHIRQLYPSPSPIQFSCKSFVPVLMKQATCSNCFRPSYETLQDTMQKVSKWIETNDAEVVNLETSVVRLHRKGVHYSSEKNYHKRERDEYFVYVIRAYLRGSYHMEEMVSEPYFNIRTIILVFLMIIILVPGFCLAAGFLPILLKQ